MVIYKIWDKKTGKGYIGKTERDFIRRKGEHLRLLEGNKHHNTHLQRIFNKDSSRICFKILEQEIKCIEQLNQKEVKYIEEQGDFNMTKGGDGGDTLSNHPNKAKIFRKRSENYPQPTGNEHPSYKEVSIEEQNLILEIWDNLPIKSLKDLASQSGVSKHLCKRVLLENGKKIPKSHETQNALRRAGLLAGSRKVEFTEEQKEYIKKRYLDDWISCKNIGKELGVKSESPILRVIEELNIKRSRSDWTIYCNLNKKIKNE
jgi:hypothetical protein